ncbi:hypothetical protein HanPI659440_Chr12g0479721 [Helianthus annuus]|nr:hypothetical protein HanPI659440_Chr12g0479721 [Helianthus annuus]
MYMTHYAIYRGHFCSCLPHLQISIFFKDFGYSPLQNLSRFSYSMAANEELKVDVEQVHVTSPPSGGGGLARQGSVSKNNCLCSPTTHAGSFRCRLHRSPSGIQRTKSINSDSKTDDHTANNVNDTMKTVIAP